MRLSDADREHLLDALATHTAAGRLSLDELERRVEALEAADTREAAQAVLADLPPLPATSATPEARRRGRGHGESEAPGAGWEPTPERFRDPRSNRVMRVWVDAGGGRHYVAEDG